MSHFQVHGPNLQVAMFSSDQRPEAGEVERIATLARFAFAD
jgi:hypothetical protein